MLVWSVNVASEAAVETSEVVDVMLAVLLRVPWAGPAPGAPAFDLRL